MSSCFFKGWKMSGANVDVEDRDAWSNTIQSPNSPRNYDGDDNVITIMGNTINRT